MLFKGKPLKHYLQRDPDAGKWKFASSYAEQVYEYLDILFQWRAGRPSEFGLCDPSDDMALMYAYTVTTTRMRRVAELDQRRKSETKLARDYLKRNHGRK